MDGYIENDLSPFSDPLEIDVQQRNDRIPRPLNNVLNSSNSLDNISHRERIPNPTNSILNYTNNTLNSTVDISTQSGCVPEDVIQKSFQKEQKIKVNLDDTTFADNSIFFDDSVFFDNSIFNNYNFNTITKKDGCFRNNAVLRPYRETPEPFNLFKTKKVTVFREPTKKIKIPRLSDDFYSTHMCQYENFIIFVADDKIYLMDCGVENYSMNGGNSMYMTTKDSISDDHSMSTTEKCKKADFTKLKNNIFLNNSAKGFPRKCPLFIPQLLPVSIKNITSVHMSEHFIHVGTGQGVLYNLDLATLKNVSKLQIQKSRIGVIKTKDNLIFTGSRDRTIKICDIRVKNTNFVDTIDCHSQEITGLAIKNEILASGGNDNKVFVYEMRMRKGKNISSPRNFHNDDLHRTPRNDMFSVSKRDPDNISGKNMSMNANFTSSKFFNQFMSSRNQPKNIYTPKMKIKAHKAAVKAIAFLSNDLLVTGGGSADKTLRVWDLKKQSQKNTTQSFSKQKIVDTFNNETSGNEELNTNFSSGSLFRESHGSLSVSDVFDPEILVRRGISRAESSCKPALKTFNHSNIHEILHSKKTFSSQITNIQITPNHILTSHGYSQNDIKVLLKKSLNESVILRYHKSRVLHFGIVGKIIISMSGEEMCLWQMEEDENGSVR